MIDERKQNKYLYLLYKFVILNNTFNVLFKVATFADRQRQGWRIARICTNSPFKYSDLAFIAYINFVYKNF